MKKSLIALLLGLLLTGVGYKGWQQYQQVRQVQLALEYGIDIAELLTDISQDWQLSRIEAWMTPSHFAANRATLTQLMQQSAYLGEMQSCTEMRLLELDNYGVADNIAMHAQCRFEHGMANVTLVLQVNQPTRAELIAILIA